MVTFTLVGWYMGKNEYKRESIQSLTDLPTGYDK